MKDGQAYFTQQQEEISNTYLSANGVQQVMTEPSASAIDRFQKKYFDFGGMFGQQVGSVVFYGLIIGGSYMLYKKLKK